MQPVTSLMCPHNAPADLLLVSSDCMQWDSLLCLKKILKTEGKKKKKKVNITKTDRNFTLPVIAFRQLQRLSYYFKRKDLCFILVLLCI